MAEKLLDYNIVDRGSELQYPTYADPEKTPNTLMSFLDAINQSNPISGCQYELVWSRWPRTRFFAKGITIPGVSVNTIDINHYGFTIPIATHVTYETTEITMNILADKEGFHYYDLRNMVLQSGHPLVAGDTRSMVGNTFNLGDEDTIEVKLRNSPLDSTYHHWTIHNFRPKSIGDVELAQDSSDFVRFDIVGTFTHITYSCGDTAKTESEKTFEEVAKDYQTDMEDEYNEEDDEFQGFGPIDDKPQEEKPEHYPVEDNEYDLSPWMNQDDESSGSGGEIEGEGEGEGEGESQDGGGEQGENLPEDWEYMSDDDKKAYNMMKNGMSEEEAQNAIKEELKKSNPSLSEDDLEAQSKAAVQNATAAKNTQENKPAPPNSVDTELSFAEQQQFDREFSDSQPAPEPDPDPSSPTTEKTRIAGEDFDGKTLSPKQMATMEMAMSMGNSYPPEIMAVYNKQKGQK